jgi:hypothetical protein
MVAPGVKTDTSFVQRKTADEVLRLPPFDFSKALGSGETLNSIASRVEPSGELSVTNETVSGALAQVLVSAGVDGKVYQVIAKVTTTSNQTLELAGLVRIGPP